MSADTISAAAAPDPVLAPPPPPQESQTQAQMQGPTINKAPALAGGKELDQIECAKPTFLNSPPDSNNALKSEGSDSELSDLEDDAVEGGAPDVEDEVKDDIGEVTPDHWSGTVPVFKPTMHQFKDFKLFVIVPLASFSPSLFG
jgi:hypothetical protein